MFDVARETELKKKALQGDPEAQCMLADMYVDPTTGTELRPAEATFWYAKAAKQKHIRAQWILGAAYFTGLWIDKDMTQSEYWFKESAIAGHVESQYALGMLYFMKPDLEKAEYWLTQSAKQGHETASAMLNAVKLISKPPPIF